MLSLSPSEKRALIILAFFIFLGTLIRYYNLEVKEVVYSSSRQTEILKININQASAACLEKLPGIGPVLAGRIVEYRRLSGPFSQISDLKKVNGIGSHKAEAMREYIEF